MFLACDGARIAFPHAVASLCSRVVPKDSLNPPRGGAMSPRARCAYNLLVFRGVTRIMTKRAVLAAALAYVAVVIGACGEFTRGSSGVQPSGRGHSETQLAVVRLIVRFRADVDPTDPAFLERLSREVGMSFAYLRPMSGGAHVLRASASPESVAGGVRRLRNRPEIADVQLDVPVRRQ